MQAHAKTPRAFLLYSRGGAWLRPGVPGAGPCGLPARLHRTPALAGPANPKIHPRTIGGPAMQAPTSKRQGLRKNISTFRNFIVGASIARPLRPCDPARLPGWSRAPPLQCTARECVKFLSPFRNSIVGAGLGSARCSERWPLRFAPQPTPNTPAPTAPTTPKIHPHTVGGPAMQAPTSERFKPPHKNTLALSII